jgi:hypothetical protein
MPYSYISGTICFGVNGKIIWAKHNCPGSWNDADTSRLFQERLVDMNETSAQACVVADTAFPVSKNLTGKILTPLKDGDLETIPPEGRIGAEKMSAAITSIRQACEWGMGAMDKPFRRLTRKLPWCRLRRKVMLKNIMRLYNVRVEYTNISQIRTVFNSNKTKVLVFCFFKSSVLCFL